MVRGPYRATIAVTWLGLGFGLGFRSGSELGVKGWGWVTVGVRVGSEVGAWATWSRPEAPMMPVSDPQMPMMVPTALVRVRVRASSVRVRASLRVSVRVRASQG